MRASTILRLSVASGVTSAMVVALLGGCNALLGIDEDVKRVTPDGGGDEREPTPGEDTGIPDTDSGTGFSQPAREKILRVALGRQHTCSKKPDGNVKCWGDDSRSQTGSTGSDGGVLVPTTVTSNVVAIAAGNNHTCAVVTGGTVKCWGDNLDGQLGDGQVNTRSALPVTVSGLSGAYDVACGANFSCALRVDGSVSCWGGGLGGQLGNGSAVTSPTPVSVVGVRRAVDIAAGESHACAVTDDGKMLCWGDNTNGQIGIGKASTTPILLPTAVTGVTEAENAAAAERSTCVRTKAGQVSCWGANELGQLGRGGATSPGSPAPSPVTGVDANHLWAGANHACAITKAATVTCWGAGDQGQLGNGAAIASSTTPVAATGVTNSFDVGTGGKHSCATSGTDKVYCWGANARGQLGTGNQTAASTPQLVPNP